MIGGRHKCADMFDLKSDSARWLNKESIIDEAMIEYIQISKHERIFTECN